MAWKSCSTDTRIRRDINLLLHVFNHYISQSVSRCVKDALAREKKKSKNSNINFQNVNKMRRRTARPWSVCNLKWQTREIEDSRALADLSHLAVFIADAYWSETIIKLLQIYWYWNSTPQWTLKSRHMNFSPSIKLRSCLNPAMG